MPDLRLYWLGPPAIVWDGRPLRLEMRKTLALLAYLSLSPQRSTRETLATLFWPEYDQQHALSNLRRNLFSLSKSFPVDLVEADRETIGLKMGDGLQVDVKQFQDLLACPNQHAHPPDTLCPECIASLENSAALYRGDFLEGFNLKGCAEFDEWQFFQRESLRSQYAGALEKLAVHYAARCEWEKAILRTRAWLALDRLHEPAQRMLMRLYLRSGQRSAALRQYEECKQLLEQELGQSPEPETLKICAEIRSGVPAREAPDHRKDTLIRTKLRLPFIRPSVVPRPELQARIAAGLHFPLTLVVAPAGFGKTTLVAASLTDDRWPVAWLSLDKDDNQAGRFLRYLIAALQGADRRIGNQAAELLSGMRPEPLEVALASLINDLDASGSEIVLVLEDYHFISSPDVHEAVAFFLEHCPSTLHILIATRSDPPLPLARLRARSQLVELRADDLRFTDREATQFLNEVMGLQLDARSVAMLAERTEGWVAGLQMAALSLREHEDAARFINLFSGTNRFILEYLSEEVLSRQPEEIRSFLLHTSILERLCGSLCDAVIGQPSNSQEKLERLNKANLFLIPLDEQSQWYRYHQLFADLLRARLQQTIGSQGTALLHLRAAEWYDQNGLGYEAIHHASLASNDELVERLIEKNYNEALKGTERSSFRFLTGKLSRELVYRRPWLCIYEAESSLWFGQLDEAEELLAAAEKHLRAEAPSPDTQAMRGHHAYVKGRVTAMRGDVQRAIQFGHIARENTPASNLALQLNIGVLLGYVYFLAGDFAKASQTLAETIQSAPASRDVIVATRCVLARLYAVQGLLNKSSDLYQKTEQSIHEAGGQQLGAMSIVNVGIADVLYEWNDLEAALTHVIQGLESIQYWGKADDIALAYTTLARIQQAQGNLPAALESIHKGSEVIHTRRVFSEARDAVVTAEIRLRLAQGDRLAVSRLTGSLEERLSSGDPFRFENELVHITLARGYLAQKNLDECLELLSRLEGNAQTGGRTGRLIQILILKALALQTLGETGQALAVLEKSLVLAEPEGYIRIFVDEGQPVQLLLAQWLAHASAGPVRTYAIHLLAQFDAEPRPLPAGPEQASPADTLVEPLSQREREVLQLIALGRTNPEIARQLAVAPGTVKAHTASIYRKLDVTNRTEAVARARQLGLLP